MARRGPFNVQIKSKSSLATFSGNFQAIRQQKNYKTLEKTALYVTCGFKWDDQLNKLCNCFKMSN